MLKFAVLSRVLSTPSTIGALVSTSPLSKYLISTSSLGFRDRFHVIVEYLPSEIFAFSALTSPEHVSTILISLFALVKF
ncbi:MAG: hypothetical protein QW540_10925 [Archaeoglobaceae archaeon]